MLFITSAFSESRSEAERERRQALLDQLRRVLPVSQPWELWLKLKGELPPDFDKLPSRPEPPDPLTRVGEGRPLPVLTPDHWTARREELLALFHEWVLGTVPPPPDNLEGDVLREQEELGATVRQVRLRFGPEERAHLRLELLIPQGAGPFPVFMTQHNHRAWAVVALKRGYLCCIYAASDSRDDTDSIAAAYPEEDWSRLTRRGWAAARCIDYLATVPQADMRKIALAGHSRNGKAALIASALDTRISVVISSSSGAGGSLPARDFSDQHFGEGLELLTRSFPEWFHPRLRFFVGREHKLPVDFNELVALTAPRSCLLSTALNDSVESTWAMQQTYLATRRVYELNDAESRLGLMWRPGGHETSPADVERYVDWCDLQFERGSHEFPERLIHPASWDQWLEASGQRQTVIRMGRHNPDNILLTRSGSPISTSEAWTAHKNDIRGGIAWLLGDAPAGVRSETSTHGKEPPHVSVLLGRGEAGDGLERDQFVIGEDVNADVYRPAGLKRSGTKAPAVLWLHPFSFSNGYVAGYHRGEQAFRTFARAGFVVLCIDQIGFGRRIEEAEGFYRRYPRGSLLGKMLRDAQAGVNALHGLPYVDKERVWTVGYGLGAMVGAHLGALDDRMAGFVSVCGPPPFRTDKAEKGTGGIRRWSHRHLLLPRMGFFPGEEERVPYDIPELIGCMAPRPVLVVSPQLDREAPLDDVTRGVEAARKVYGLYGAAARLEQLSPEDFNHFDSLMQERVVEWLKGR